MASPSNLAAVASDILAYCLDALGSRAPDRSYIQAGQIALDGCDQLVVAFGGQGMAPVGDFPGKLGASTRRPQVPAADFVVMASRCVPSMANGPLDSTALPDPADIQSAAEEILADTETLWCALAESFRSKAVFGACQLVSMGSAVPYGPSGGVGGVSITLTVQTGCPAPAS